MAYHEAARKVLASAGKRATGLPDVIENFDTKYVKLSDKDSGESVKITGQLKK